MIHSLNDRDSKVGVVNYFHFHNVSKLSSQQLFRLGGV